MPCSRASFKIAPKFTGLPPKSTAVMTLVLGVMRLASAFSSIFPSNLTGANLTSAPAISAAFAVAANVMGVVITSSSSRTPSARYATCSADVAEFIATTCFTPTYLAIASSNLLTLSPPVRISSFRALTTAAMSESVICCLL